ncbi:lipid-binding protein [Pontibacter sp. H259]|uniref:lipid-binding protein n=1 Tax=Pontibacter sp. H259 TaxID=3133421 RepID=UPI0030BEB9EA
MKTRYTYIITVLLLAVSFLSSCERDDPEVEMTAIGNMAGEWYVTHKVETSPGVFEDVFGVGYVTILTYNTSENTADFMFVDDLGHFWEYKTLVDVSPTDKSFSAPDGENLYYDSDGVSINNGKIIIGGGESRTGVKTDSIYYEVSFGDDDEGFTYIVSGHRRTGFAEDEF